MSWHGGTEFSLDWAPEAVVVVVADGDGSIAYANPRAEDLLGYRRDELVERPLALVIPELAGGAAALREAPLRHSSRVVSCAHRDGTRFPAAIRWRPGPPGREHFVVLSLREREGREPADDVAARQYALITLFSHDVRRSLQSIQFLCDSVAESVPRTVSTIAGILASVRALFDTLLRLGEAETVRPVMRPCPLDPIISDVVRVLSPDAERRGVELSVETTQAAVVSDPALLRELLYNLLASAIRHTREGPLTLRGRALPGALSVEICHSGAMDVERIDAVLSGRSLEPEASGAGGERFALLIARRLAELLGCRVQAERAEAGACMAVRLPRGRGPGPEERAEPDPQG